MESNLLINGDCLVELKKLSDNSIDLIFADPPYWMRTTGKLKRVEGSDYDGVDDEWDKFGSLPEYEQFTTEWLKECYRVLKKDGSIWVIGGLQCIYTIGAIMLNLGFWFINDVIWHKSNPTPNFLGTRLNNSHETLIWATKSSKSNYHFNYKTAKELNVDQNGIFTNIDKKQMGSIWKMPVSSGNERLKDGEGKKLHSTQKPEQLLYRVIAISSQLGDIVLDPFGGTMTTATIAKRMGRRFISIEKEKKYFDFGKKRVEETDAQIGPIEQATFDVKPPKVTIKDMIENDVLKIGDRFLVKNSKEFASLRADGKLDYNGNAYDIHTCAALIKGVKADRLNGFDHWFIRKPDGDVSLSDLREQMRSKITKNE
jgi:site-specific DNA-methyltransferase (adenine-specific)